MPPSDRGRIRSAVPKAAVLGRYDLVRVCACGIRHRGRDARHRTVRQVPSPRVAMSNHSCSFGGAPRASAPFCHGSSLRFLAPFCPRTPAAPVAVPVAAPVTGAPSVMLSSARHDSTSAASRSRKSNPGATAPPTKTNDLRKILNGVSPGSGHLTRIRHTPAKNRKNQNAISTRPATPCGALATLVMATLGFGRDRCYNPSARAHQRERR